MKLKGVFCIGIIALCLAGCGAPESNATVTARKGQALQILDEPEEMAEAVEIQEIISSNLYIVENMDMANETITVYSVEEKRQLRYKYNMTTKFLDKYGDNCSWDKFTTGTVVNLGSKLPVSGAISEVQISDDVWVYDEVKKFDIDAERNIFNMAGSNYKLLSTTKIYSDNNQILISDLSDKDTVSVVGVDKEILAISVKTGHGYIQLTNTKLFNNSLIFIGNKIVTMVYGDNKIEVPEGTYKITVANDGWGGSADFEVKRNEVTEVNLDSLKGEGPSYCEVTFLVTVPDTYVYVDGKLVDTNEAQKLRYGSHKLTVNCNGYNSWNKTLVVNSESATITLEMEETTAADSVETSSGSNQNNTNTSTNNSSETTTNTTGNSNTNSAENYDYETDYLTTLSDLLSNILN